MTAMFADRADAGAQLARLVATRLGDNGGRPVVVLGLPRGGVPVAAPIAALLRCSLDVVIVRKLGVPWQPELAMGAIGEDGARVLDRDVIAAAHVSAADLAAVEATQRQLLDERVAGLRTKHPKQRLTGCTAVIVDDGLATGATARVAMAAVHARGAFAAILAVPVAPLQAVTQFRSAGDDIVCVATPSPFVAVGAHYRDFSPPSDAEVLRLLEAHRT